MFERKSWGLVVLALVAGCPGPGQPAVELIAPSFVSNQDAMGGTVRISVTTAQGAPGTGSVALSTTLGELGAASLSLESGAARTTIRCVAGPSGACVGSAEVTATWTSGGDTARSTVTVRFGPPSSSDGGRGDGGSPDGGRPDAGRSDAGPPDGGFDAGASGTSIRPLGRILVFGEIRDPTMTSLFGVGGLPEGDTRLGWRSRPLSPSLFGDSLAYVTEFGEVRLWVADTLSSADGPRTDAGADAGAPDGGTDAGLRFPLVPELNDLTITVPGCSTGVERLVPAVGGSWALCRPGFGTGWRLVQLPDGIVRLQLGEVDFPLAVSTETLLFRVARPDGGVPELPDPDAGLPDGGRLDSGIGDLDALYVLNGTNRQLVRGSTTRAFGHARPYDLGFIVTSRENSSPQCRVATISLLGTLTEVARPGLPADAGCLAAFPTAIDEVFSLEPGDAGLVLQRYELPEDAGTWVADGGFPLGGVVTDVAATPPTLGLTPPFDFLVTE